jgi:hypothetical protein
MAMDQKAAFADRLNRIKAGQQFEHADLVGHQTQVAYKKIHGDKARKPKRTPVEKLMVLVAFLSGISAVLLGRLAYFHLSKISGLPEAFYDLQGRGMALFALVLAGILIVIFGLSTRSRLQSLALRLRAHALRRSGGRIDGTASLGRDVLARICGRSFRRGSWRRYSRQRLSNPSPETLAVLAIGHRAAFDI